MTAAYCAGADDGKIRTQRCRFGQRACEWWFVEEQEPLSPYSAHSMTPKLMTERLRLVYGSWATQDNLFQGISLVAEAFSGASCKSPDGIGTCRFCGSGGTG